MHMSRDRARAIFLGLLLVGGILRFQGLNWDAGHHLHPDERFISMVEEKIAFPKSAGEYFDSARSSLNPYNKGEGSFVYGTLPMVLAKAVASARGRKGYDETYLIGRALSGVFDLLTVWLVYRITRRFTQRRAALFAAGLSAFCALGIQLSHFWAVDTFLTTFTAATLYGAVRIAQNRSGWAGAAATGVALGLAVACKITALALLLPIGVAILVRGPDASALGRREHFPLCAAALRDPRRDGRHGSRLSPPRLPRPEPVVLPPRSAMDRGPAPPHGAVELGGGVPSGPAMGRADDPLSGRELRPLGRGRLLRDRGPRRPGLDRPRDPPAPGFRPRAPLRLLPLPRGVPRPDPRQVDPLLLPGVPRARRADGRVLFDTPHAVPAAAPGARGLRRDARRNLAVGHRVHVHLPPPPDARRGEPVDLCPRSRGAAFGNESWDDGLPLPMPGYDPARYAGPSIPLFDPDSPQKAEVVVRMLQESDWIAVTSGRVYTNVTRVPDVFPMSVAYYRALFDGTLGFERAADFTSYPSLGPLHFPDDGAEEQFTVYDHPRVLLFRKTARFSADRAKALLLAAMPRIPPTMNDWERWPRALRRVSAPVRPDRAARAEKATTVEPAEGGMGSLLAAILWYLALGAVGLAAMPFAWALFPRFQDRGFGFARLLGLVFATYAMAVAVTLRLMPNGRPAAITCLLLVAACSAWVFLRERHDLLRFLREHRRELVQSEIVFAAGFLLFLGIRALNPEIYWGEKPMDFSILNILVRTRSLPPSDPWLAGAPLGYYTLGQEMVVLLTFLTNLSTRFTFNLAFGMLGGTILQGAFSLGRNWGGRIRSGIAAAGMTLLLGNLSGLRDWIFHKRVLDWDYFWATSRVIRDTINEYPFWSLTFADLHAHVLAIPIFLLFAAAALHLVRLHGDPVAGWRTRLGGAALLGFLAAAQGLTNAWDVPLLIGLLVLVPLTASLMTERISFAGLGRAAAAFSVAAASAYVLARPLWVRIGGTPAIGKNLEASSSGVDQLTVFGLFLYLALCWWFAAGSGRLAARGVSRPVRWILVALAAGGLAFLAVKKPDAFLACGVVLFLGAFLFQAESREDRLALGFLATAFFLVLFCQRLYIYDRMNTFFKLYLEAWLLFAIATAVLVFRARDRRGAIDGWIFPARVGAAVLASAALFTSVTAGRAAVSRHFAPYSGPSLDGLRYLETLHPGEYRAVLWLRRTVAGTPVVLEAQGPSYQDFSRISMLTGLPTVLGWDYHVEQRGNSASEVEARRGAVKAIYTNPESARVERLLRRYGVGYVYVGWLERKTYPPEGLQKFQSDKSLFELVYENPETQIYRVAGGPAQDVIVPAKESLPPAAAAAAQPQDEPEEKPSLLEKAGAAQPPFANLKEPRGAAVDARGRLWVADFGNSHLRVFDAGGGYLGGWGGRGGGQFGFKELCGVAIAGDDLYIADTWNGRVQAYTLAGLFRATVGDLYGPRGIAVAPDGRVWVTDAGNHRVVSYDALLQDPKIVGSRGAGRDQFSSPIGIAAAPSGVIYVADTGNRRIQVLGPDGAFRGSFPFPGWGENVEPHLAVDTDGTIYATEPQAAAVLELDPAGHVQRRITEDGAGRKFEKPTGIAIDRKNRILYVINTGNASVSTIALSNRRTP